MKTVFAFMVILNLSSATYFTDKEKTAVTKEVKQMLGSYYADIKKDGLTAEFNYLDNSVDFFWMPPGYKSSISY